MAGAAAQDQWEDVTPGAVVASTAARARAGKADDEWEDVTPTPKAAATTPAKPGFVSTVATDIGSMVKPMVGMGGVQREDPEQFRQRFAAMSPEEKAAQIAQTRAVAVGMPHSDIASREAENYQTRVASGQSMPRAVAETTYEAGAGANMTGFDQAAAAGNTREAIGHLAAPVVLGAATEAMHMVPEAADAIGETRIGQNVKDSIGRATRTPGVITMQPDGTGRIVRSGPLKPAVKLGSQVVGAGAGAAVGETGLGPYGGAGGAFAGWRVGPHVADLILPEHPNPVGDYSPLPKRMSVPEPELPGTGAPLPDAGEFYENKGDELMKRGKEQDALDRKAKAQELKEAKSKVAIAGQETPGAPKNTGSEGRAATWTNEKVVELAKQGNRQAITQVARRQLDAEIPNMRYIMGDPDAERVVLNPREVTRFAPDGTPIRNTSNPITQNPSSRARVQIVGEQPSAKVGAPSPVDVGTPKPSPAIPSVEEYEDALYKNGMRAAEAHKQAVDDIKTVNGEYTLPDSAIEATRERINKTMSSGAKSAAVEPVTGVKYTQPSNETGTQVQAAREANAPVVDEFKDQLESAARQIENVNPELAQTLRDLSAGKHSAQRDLSAFAREKLNESESAAEFDQALADAKSDKAPEGVQELGNQSPEPRQRNLQATELGPPKNPQAIVESAGAKFVGIQKGYGARPDQVLFQATDGSTSLSLDADKVTPEAIRKKISEAGK